MRAFVETRSESTDVETRTDWRPKKAADCCVGLEVEAQASKDCTRGCQVLEALAGIKA